MSNDPAGGSQRLYAKTVFYPTLAWNMLLGRVLKFRNWWDSIDPHVILGAYPFACDVDAMHAAGVRAVVNTCEEYCGPIDEYQRRGIEQFHMPTTDFTHPKLSDVAEAVEFVNRHVEQGQGVYIHCKAGRARSATVALCWLMKYRDHSLESGQQHLIASRPHVNPEIYKRPVVVEFANGLREV